MNWHKSLLVLFFIASIFISCSDNGSKDDPATPSAPATTNTAAVTVTSAAKEKRSDASEKRLKGKVQMLTEMIYPGENAKTFSGKNVFKYDQNGNQFELSNYKSDGGLVSTIKSTYDPNGKIVSEETVLPNGTVDIKSEIKTDANGNKVEQMDKKQNTSGNLFNYKHQYVLNEKGQRLEWVAYRGNGSFFFKYTFNYDANGNRTEWLRLTQTNVILAKVVTKYDDKNNMTEESTYNSDGTLKTAFTYTYEFDKKGNWIRQKKMQNGAVVEVKVREYKYY
jgi:hypothetical protein